MHRRLRQRWVPWLLLAGCACLGCADRPRAPALQHESVYQNDDAGFRFQAPAEWYLTAKSAAPPTPQEKPRLLVRYDRDSAIPTTLEVTTVDLAPETKLPTFIQTTLVNPVQWLAVPPVEELTIGGKKASRFVFQAPPAKPTMVKEIVAFSAGQRYYFFIGMFPVGDPKSRDMVRQAVNGVTWHK